MKQLAEVKRIHSLSNGIAGARSIATMLTTTILLITKISMKKNFNKIKNIIFKLGNIKIRAEPYHSDVVVYDNQHPDEMKIILGNNTNVNIEPLVLYFSLPIGLKMLQNLRMVNKGLFFWNHAAVLIIIQPKLVITVIDNSRRYNELDRLLHLNFKFLTIQNGNRFFNPTPCMRKDSNKNLSAQEKSACLLDVYHSEFYCFGRFEEDLYNKLSAKIEKFNHVGSLINSIHMREKKIYKDYFDICLISGFSINSELRSPLYYKGYSTLCEWMAKYISEHRKVRLCIAGRSKIGEKYIENERKWYSHYGLEKYLHMRERRFSSYEFVDKSNLTVCGMTTMFFESLARKNKVLYVDPMEYEIVALPKLMRPESILYLYGSTYEEFEERINRLLVIEKKEYLTITNDYSSYMMNNNSKNPTYKIIQQDIDNILLNGKL